MTIKDIAKNLNVSYSTVSLSLNNDPRVAEKTKKRVIEEAEPYTYGMSASLRNLYSASVRVLEKITRPSTIFPLTILSILLWECMSVSYTHLTLPTICSV